MYNINFFNQCFLYKIEKCTIEPTESVWIRLYNFVSDAKETDLQRLLYLNISYNLA